MWRTLLARRQRSGIELNQKRSQILRQCRDQHAQLLGRIAALSLNLESFEARTNDLTARGPRFMTNRLRRTLARQRKQLSELAGKLDLLREQIRTLEDDIANPDTLRPPERTRVVGVPVEALILAA